MEVRDLIVEVRDANLNRVGQIVAANLPGLKLVQRFNNVGTWEITLPADDPIADELRAAGAGIIVTGDTGILMSGFTTSAVKEVTPADPVGAWKIQGVDDSVILGERLAYPTPGTADVTAQTTETDARSGFASTVMYEYVDANIGPSAPAAREIPFLSLAADAGLGSTVYKTARFRVLGEVLSEIGSIDPIGFRIQQSGDLLEFSCYAPTDRTGEIRLDVVNDTLSKSSYGYGVPSVTRAIVGGTGQGTSRTFLEVSDTESLAAETLWGRRIETFVDQNNETDTDVLNQAGLEKIAEGGRTGTSVSVLPSSDLTMTYGRDWYLGDRVTVVVGGQEVSATVTETAITVASDGIRIGATVGDPSGVDFDALITKREQSTPKRLNAAELKEGGSGGGSTTGGLPVGGTAGQILSKIDSTNYNSRWVDNYAEKTYYLVRNNTGSTIPKGTLVSATGAEPSGRIDVAPHETTGLQDSELRVMGVTTSGISNGVNGEVVSFGTLTGLDTRGNYSSALAVGDETWAEGDILFAHPTVAGKLTKVRPRHDLAVAFITVRHASAGQIAVRIVPGNFHLEWLHDVEVDTPADNEVLAYDSASSLWKNQTAAEAGLLASGSTAGGDLTGTYPSPSLVATGTAGTYTKVTTDTKGRVTSGTTLSASDVPSLDASKITSGTLPVANGGTGASTAETARSNLSAVGVFAQDSEPAGGNIGDIWIDTDSGQNTIGATPRFEAVKTTAQSFGNGSSVTVTYTTIDENVGGFTQSSGVVTLPLTGRYSLSAYIGWANSSSGRRVVRFLKNGTGIWSARQPADTQGGGTPQALSVNSYRFNSGDTVEFEGVQGSGGTMSVDDAKFIVEYLGA